MKVRWTIMAIAMGFAILVLFRPSEDGDSWTTPNIDLGLDLQGGIFMQLEVDTDDAVNQYLEEQAGTIKASIEAEDFDVTGSDFDLKARTVTLKGVSSVKKEDKVLSFLKDNYGFGWNITQRESDYVFKLKDRRRIQVQNDAVTQTVYKIQNRIDELGVTEPVINRAFESSRIILELAGADDVERVNNIVKEPGKLEWRLVRPGSNTNASTEEELLRPYGGTLPEGTKVFPYETRTGETVYMLLEEVLMTARHVQEVYPTRDDRGLPAVGINLNREGGQIFANETEKHVGDHLAVVLDKKILTPPVIQQKLGSRFQITGRFTSNEVVDMVIKIKSGSLPAEVRVLEERVIGPTLGRDARNQGALSAVIGLILVVIFMVIWYSRAGIYSVVALTMNLVLILGLLAGLEAVLTLPGIAGFILTIGMAVDANVLIFERIREELRKGILPKHAVDTGFKTAFVTILDANITTFIAAFCLLLMGQGPIKGFAVMLMIGIVSSIFTAVFCSRTLFNLHLIRKHPDTLQIWPLFRRVAPTTQS